MDRSLDEPSVPEGGDGDDRASERKRARKADRKRARKAERKSERKAARKQKRRDGRGRRARGPDDAGVRPGLLLRLVRENLRRHSGAYGLGMVAMALAAGATAGSAVMVRYIVDALAAPADSGRVAWVALGAFALFAVRGVAGYLQVVTMTRAGTAVAAEQQVRLFEKVLRQGVGFFTDWGSAKILARVTGSANAARQVIDILVTTFVRDLLTAIGLLAVMVAQQPRLTVASLVVAPGLALGMRALARRMRALRDVEAAAQKAILQVLQETTFGIQVIKVFGLERQMSRRMRRAVADAGRRRRAVARIEAMSIPLVDVTAGVLLAGLVLSQGSGGSASAGEIVSFVTALMLLYEPGKRLARTRLSLELQMNGVRRMYEIMDAPEEPAADDDVPVRGVRQGDIVFEGVRFAYPGGGKALRGLDARFAAGRTTALVGPSGAGKSTLLGMILRLHDPDEGRILVGGQDLRDHPVAGLRARMAFVGQSTFLFDGTVRDNIRVGRRGATDADIEAAAVAAQAHDFIARLPDGYDTEIGENGALLSGGERQRLAIARAFLRDAPILLLDEATSALDAHSEAAVRDALGRLRAGRTTVVIAHRLSTILRADAICYMQDGRIVEQGDLGTLLGRDGPFRRMYDEQFRDLPA